MYEPRRNGDDRGPTTKDYLRAIEATRATLTDEMIREFDEDIERLSRL